MAAALVGFISYVVVLAGQETPVGEAVEQAGAEPTAAE